MLWRWFGFAVHVFFMLDLFNLTLFILGLYLFHRICDYISRSFEFTKTTHYLQAKYTGGIVTLSGSEDIINKLDLPETVFPKVSYKGFAEIVIRPPDSPIPLDALFLAIYSRACSLSGTILEQSSLAEKSYRYVLWSFPSSSFLSRILRPINSSFLLKSVALGFVIRSLSSYILDLGFYLFLCMPFILYFHPILHKVWSG